MDSARLTAALRSALSTLGRGVLEGAAGRRLPDQRRPGHNERRPDPGAPPPGGPARGGYAGDFRGVPTIDYAPASDGDPDPGEIVWAWVPYEEDHTRGKDRPVLVIGHDGALLLALQVTSQDHDRDAAQEARAGRYWMDIGTGPWDPQGRPSEVRVNRILRLDPRAVRREGSALDRRRYEEVTAEVLRRAR